jgi:hypothetical protein
MIGSNKGKRAGRPATANRVDEGTPKATAQMQLSIGVAGDQRLTENIIVEVLAAARRCGLAPPDVAVLRQPRVGAKSNLKAGKKSK